MIWYVWTVIGHRGAGSISGAGVRPEPVEDVAGNGWALSLDGAPRLGSAQTGPVLIEFSDFECPFCRRHAQRTLDDLKAKLIDPGRVVYAYRHLPLENHVRALPAAIAAQCGFEQHKFWEMHARLFAGSGLSREEFVQAARDVNLDLRKFTVCLSKESPRVKSDLAEAERFGIRSTPTFLLGVLRADGRVSVHRKIRGAQSLEVFAGQIEKLSAAANR